MECRREAAVDARRVTRRSLQRAQEATALTFIDTQL
jgi:hypothetical protein